MTEAWTRATAEPVIRAAINRAENAVVASAGSKTTCNAYDRMEHQTLKLAIHEILDAMFPLTPEEAVHVNLARAIEDLPLTMREYNTLKREGIHTVQQLVTWSAADLNGLRGWGRLATDRLTATLKELGLSLSPVHHQKR